MATISTDPPIGGIYDVDTNAALPDAAGGLPAFVASSRRSPAERLMAVRVRKGQAPRAHPLAVLHSAVMPGLVVPLAFGNAPDGQGRLASYVICRRPPGRSLALPGPASGGSVASGGPVPSGGPVSPAAAAQLRPWSESELIDTVIRPVAAALAQLESHQVTHRAIRPDNVFQTLRGHPVVLGCAWAAPPAFDQPAVYEPPYSAACLPAGRGEGLIADDIYALGVLVVALIAGGQPLAGLDPAAVVARKLAHGSFTALTAEVRLPPMIADLVRSMVAEEPDHRPPPALLINPEAARARRLAARPIRFAQRSIEVGVRTAWNRRGLAHLLAIEPFHAPLLLRSGAVDRWLRRSLGDPGLAQEVEEVVKARQTARGMEDIDADAMMVLRAVTVLDPLAPPVWRGLVLWPSAIGACLAAATPEQEPALTRLVDLEVFVTWATIRPDRNDPAPLRAEALQQRRLLHLPGWGGGLARLRYTINPLLPCRSRHVHDALVSAVTDLLPALDAAAAQPDRPALPLDAELGAFIAARFEARSDVELASLANPNLGASEAALAQLRVLMRIQARHPGPPVPGLAAWLADALAAVVAGWRSRTRQAEGRAALAEQAAAGRLAALLGVVENPAAKIRDNEEAALAEHALRELDARIEAVTSGSVFRREQARRLGQEIAGACGAVAVAIAAALVLV